ncbi:manganese-dependent inorganic pyrophosphatase [Sporosarcina aquimarina]|uniref:Probable manganese-dependent inorganic pyrophosphatase n=1 Tax=Sporosarcina aquimarina TaxID=114975 RepID=A0ABU4FZH7_9BACL|nr:manganese-dependent inorganic pyrophosphatase [Sporosarcina aquimarina]MDW0110121.1 manganese-dependent inorganic pyrophosphatase [Sporosarcina aquimarina]
MNKVLVFGHKNPDTDSIASAITYAYLKQQIGLDAEAVRLGSVSEETAFALETFGFEAPRQIDRAKTEASQVILVDHNEKQQSVDDIEEVKVLEVIDHHRIANFQTNEPLYYRAEPVGCTATILNKLFKENGVDIPKNIAGLMLSAIISDSLLFKSPTFTEEDKKAADELAKIAEVDAATYGLDMLKAGADLSSKTLEELISLDAKTFEVGDVTMEIAQVNAVDLNDILNRKEELTQLLTQVVSVKKLDLFLFVITDIINNDSIAIAIGEKAFPAMTAFNVVPANDMAILSGIVSRKKQIVPVLTEAFK